ASVILAVYLLALRLGLGGDVGRTAALVVALLPSLVWYSTQDLRDPIETCALAWSALGLFGLLRRPRRAGLIVLLLVMDVLAVLYRPYVGLLLFGGQLVAAGLVMHLGRGAFPRALRVLLLLVAFAAGAMISVRETAALYNVHGLSLNRFVLAQGVREQVLQQAGSAYPIKLQIHGFADAALKLPLLVVMLMLTPLPFLPGSAAMMATYPEMWFLYLWVVPNFVRGFRYLWRRDRQALVILLSGLVPIVAAYSIRIAAAGLALRLRTQFLPLLLVLAALGAVISARRKKTQPTLAQRYLTKKPTAGDLAE
ncbi:MAG: hypothetical protein J7M26_07000, partial [Armatimonadetes bacterium]|nr:hypothetical protein [Armatimonadota bacterium]